MNLSRLLLLLSLIASATLLAMNQLAPPIFERQTRDVLFSRLDAEIRFLEQRERSAALQRELVATQIADSAQLRSMLDAGPDASRAITESFAAIAQEAIDRSRVPFHTVTLIGPSGQLLTPSPQRGVLTTEELVAGAHAPLALERRASVHHVFAITGRLFESVSVPVPGPVGDVLGAVVLIQEVNGATAAERRTGASTDIAYFAQLEIIADTLPGVPMRERALALVRRTNEGNIGRGGRIQLAETERFRPPAVDGSSSQQADRMELMAPIALPVSNVDETIQAEYGAVVIVEAEWPPTSLAAFLIKGHAFDDGTMVLWSFIAAALGLFFLGIILDDAVRSRLMNRLAETVEVIAQSNHPQPIAESSYPSIYRPMVRAVNALMEEYRSRASAARRAREEADEANRRVDQVTGNVPDVSKLILGDDADDGNADSTAVGSGAFSAALSESESTSDTIEFVAPRPSVPSAPVPRPAPAKESEPDAQATEKAGLAGARTDAMPAVTDSDVPREAASAPLRHTPPPLPVASRTPAADGGTIGMMAASAASVPSPPLAEEEINPEEFDFVSNSINQVAAEFLTESGADDDSGLSALAKEPTDADETDTSSTISETARFFNDLDGEDDVPSDFAQPQPVSMEVIASESQPAPEPEPASSTAPTVRPSPLRPPLTPTTARPMMSRTSPMSSLPDPATLSSELPSHTGADQQGRPAATTDVAVQAVVSTTESSGVSALIDSIIAQRPSGSHQASPSGSWPPSHVDADQPEDPNAITSPPPFGEELSRESVEPAVSRDFSRGGSSSPTNPAIQTVGMAPVERATATTPPEPTAPEPPSTGTGTLHAIQSGALAAALEDNDRYNEEPEASAQGEQIAAPTRVAAPPAHAPDEPDMPSDPPSRPLRTMAMTPAAALMPADLDDDPSPELLDAFEKMGLSPSRVGIRTIGDGEVGATETSALIHAEDLIARAEEKLARLSSTAEETFLLFDEFTKARAQCGESTSELTFSKFTRKLERSREQLKERYQAERVDFSVAIVDGKATLKARPVRD